MLAVLASPVANGDGDGPPEGPPLDVWGEWERLQSALGTRDAVGGNAAPWAVGRLTPPTAEALGDMLVPREPGYQVLHFACHGQPDGVFIEDRLGRERFVPTAELVAKLRGSTVQLVVFNACETEEVARSLVDQAGIAAVVATRKPIYDDEAKILALRFYRRLGLGEPVGPALEAARETIRQRYRDGSLPTWKGDDPEARAANLLLVGDPRLRLGVEPPAAPDPYFALGLPPHNDPLPMASVRGFVGRYTELLRMAKWLEETGRVAFSLSGVGGIGKTAIALNAALRAAHRFDALCFATAKGRPDFGAREVLTALAAAVSGSVSPFETEDPVASIAARLNQRRTLLVLDNLEDLVDRSRDELAQALGGVDAASGSRVVMTLRPGSLDPLTRLVEGRDRQRIEVLDPPSALRLAWEEVERQDLSLDAPPPAKPLPPATEAQLKALARSAFLPGLPLAWVAVLTDLNALAFHHPTMILLAVAMAVEHDWEKARGRLKRLASQDVQKALKTLIGAMVVDLEAESPEALTVLRAALVFQGGAREDHLRYVALGRELDAESAEAVAFDDGPLRSALRSNLLTANGSRFDLDPPVRAYLERFRAPDTNTRRELELRHARALVAVTVASDDALVKSEASLAALPEWPNLTAAWDRLAALVPADEEASRALLAHAAKWQNILLNVFDHRREYWLKAAAGAAQHHGNTREQANTLKAIGDVMRFRKLSDGALDHYHRALQSYRNVDDRLGEANTLKAIGDVMKFRARYDDALDYYRRGLLSSRDVGDHLGEANTLRAIGDVMKFLDRYDDALDHYNRALLSSRNVGDRLGEANTLRAIGELLLFQKQFDEALDHFNRALRFFRDVGDHLGEGNTLRAIGDVMKFLDRYDDALNHYNRALQISRDIGERLGEANTLQGIGEVLQLRHQLDDALDHYNRALGYFRDVGERLGEAKCVAAVGQIELIRGDRTNADRRLAEAVTIYESIGPRYLVAAQIGNYGWVLIREGRRAEATPYLRRAADLFEAMGMNDYAERHRRAAEEEEK